MLGAEKLFLEAGDTDRQERLTVYACLRMSFNDTGVRWELDKEVQVKNRILADERIDEMVRKTGIPQGIHCRQCGSDMVFELTDFTGESFEVVFFFSCPLGHAPRRAVYADGREYREPEQRCSYCNGKVWELVEKKRNKFIFTDTCQDCEKVATRELIVSKAKILPIDESERKKYCTDFVRRRTFRQDLKALADLPVLEADEKEAESQTMVIEKLSVVMLEVLLSKEAEEHDFTRLRLEKLKTSRWLKVEFSILDSIDRPAEISIKKLKG